MHTLLHFRPRAAPGSRAGPRHAAARNVEVHFQVADALALGDDTTYDTVIDSALFHIFDADDRARIRAQSAPRLPAGRVGARLALSDTGPGFGPQVSDATIREAFSQRWVLEDLRSVQYQGVIVRDEHVIALHRQTGEFVDLPAWLARARRI